MAKVSMDALIPREAFEVNNQLNQNTGTYTTTLRITDLEKKEFFFADLRKPDFQRETNDWDEKRICEFIESFLEVDLIPAVILWKGTSSYTFIIDGSHRLSALVAWINDDYGDGEISQKFYEYKIPEEQIDAADKTRKLINGKIGSYQDYRLSLTESHNVNPNIAAKAKRLGTIAIQIQWVVGDSSKAAESFFKINQKAAPINETELRLLRARKKPNGVATRAIIRSGKGHKYWSGFSNDKQDKIQAIAKEINEIFFSPNFSNTIKTLDVPIGGKNYSSQSLALVLEFVNIVNNVEDEDNLEKDVTGDETLQFLTKSRKVAKRINSDHASSLGLHPIVYFYSPGGRHKLGAFYGVVALILHLEANKSFANFIKVRSDFESIIWQYEYLITQIVTRKRSAIDGSKYVKLFYLKIIDELLQGTPNNFVISKTIADPDFKHLKLQETDSTDNVENQDFSRATKSAVFIKEALSQALRCKICHGYLHSNSIQVDHILRKRDGGSGTQDNAQLTHPYCNSTLKN
ncbi:Protein of unknown function DUF262 [Cylindrospermum stagnale PCC 7417]|uniref:HNH nuclease domain-containing protein n=1 Tax=Cylindrospermum stagnale PCC 7417 TaxID=56107 RepID=K9X4C1_9NOST|nr:DUF262 domain-containing protein [Cylindrospermum stagnale]AFZ26512.1 Protein of unknown function DUF262 [Cylindrospermum stagnale PCC 7417]